MLPKSYEQFLEMTNSTDSIEAKEYWDDLKKSNNLSVMFKFAAFNHPNKAYLLKRIYELQEKIIADANTPKELLTYINYCDNSQCTQISWETSSEPEVCPTCGKDNISYVYKD